MLTRCFRLCGRLEDRSANGDGPQELAVFAEVQDLTKALLGFAFNGFVGVEGVVRGEDTVVALRECKGCSHRRGIVVFSRA